MAVQPVLSDDEHESLDELDGLPAPESEGDRVVDDGQIAQWLAMSISTKPDQLARGLELHVGVLRSVLERACRAEALYWLAAASWHHRDRDAGAGESLRSEIEKLVKACEAGESVPPEATTLALAGRSTWSAVVQRLGFDPHGAAQAVALRLHRHALSELEAAEPGSAMAGAAEVHRQLTSLDTAAEAEQRSAELDEYRIIARAGGSLEQRVEALALGAVDEAAVPSAAQLLGEVSEGADDEQQGRASEFWSTLPSPVAERAQADLKAARAWWAARQSHDSGPDAATQAVAQPRSEPEDIMRRPKPSIWNWLALAVLLGLSGATYFGPCGGTTAREAR